MYKHVCLTVLGWECGCAGSGLVVYVRLDLRMGVCHQEMLDCPPWDPRLAILRSFDHSLPISDGLRA